MLPHALQATTHIETQELHTTCNCLGCLKELPAEEMVWYEDYYQYKGTLTYGVLPWCTLRCLLMNWQIKGNA